MIPDIIIKRLIKCFPMSFVNKNNEFIAEKRANEYFLLGNCETELDVQCKVLEWLSRAAFKSQPYRSDFRNEEFHDFMLKGINDFLETDFSKEDMEIIYTYLGNAIKHEKTIEFIKTGYDMDFFKQFEN